MKRLVPATAMVATTITALAFACSSTESDVPAAPESDGGGVDSAPIEEPDAQGAPDVLGDTLNAPCSPVKQDCTDPNLRCQIVYVGGLYKTGCQPPWEPAKNRDGEVCSRKYVGYDDCIKGYHCMPEGVTATACHKFCGADTDCPSGSKCGVITDQPPFYGVCWKTCTPFGNECDGGTCASARQGIDGVNLFESCREIGSAAVGETCKQQYNCGPDMNCRGFGTFSCKAMCDDNHPCEAGACGKLPGIPNNGGVCP